MPTDESLPHFLIRPSADEDPFHQTIFHSHDYRPAEPAYLKTRSKHPDEYAVALLDAYIPDILFAQVLAKPTISTPTLSLDEIRRQNNGGAPTLPIITLPTEFTVQLYNPESQVQVKQKQSKWTGSYWEFTLPKKSFRQPTGSRLDAEVARTSGLPPSGVSTFRWRKDGGVVSKTSLKCVMLSTASSSTDPSARKKGGGEPDIPVAIMDKLKDVTIYESNLNRVDVEDRKGLELVLVLTATVIADIYFTAPSTSFNIGIQPAVTASTFPNVRPQRPMPTIIPTSGGKSSSPTSRTSPITLLKTPSPTNRAQNIVNPVILQESAHLQRQQKEEDRRRAEAERRRAKEAAEDERRVRKLLEQEEKERRRREQQVNAETERLRKQYSTDTLAWERLQKEQGRQTRPQGHQSRPSGSHPPSAYNRPPPPVQPPRPVSQQLPPRQPLYSVAEDQQARPQYLTPNSYVPPVQHHEPKRKTSGFLRVFGGGESSSKLGKKKSSLW